MKKYIFPYLFLLLIACGGASIQEKDDSNNSLANDDGLQLDKLNLPEGFTIDVYARVNNARSMAMSPSGILYVGNRGGDKVYAVEDSNNDFKADKIFTIAEEMRMPNGVAFKDGNLYVAEVSKLWKFPNVEKNLNSPTKELIYDDYPTDGHHGWKYIAFGPDGKLYVPVGAPCNLCESKNEMYASITRMNPDGSDREVYVSGVRNNVGITWHPDTDEMYFTDNGRDMLGDDTPPCELNRATEKGQHFGYPYCHAGTIKDPEFGDKRPCSDFVKPVQSLGPHVAPLGLKFYTGSMFPSSYSNKIFIAEHGSWNRSKKIGYRISIVTEENGSGKSYEPFIYGWLDEESQTAWGRPVDVLTMKDGSLLISDDLSGTIYRVSYKD
ncbi:MAG: sorbosone dehydrogenase family protein [Cyclobacteriaceae bacterium]